MRNHSRDLAYLSERDCHRKAVPMVHLIVPHLEDLWFRQAMMADPDTMSYNHAWGGTIPFPEARWQDWYEHWVLHHEGKRFYRYVVDKASNAFVGEAAYHWDKARAIWCADVIIHAEHRHHGYGRAALRLLCEAARVNGVDVLRDDIAIDNPAIGLFLSEEFVEEYRTAEIIMLRKELR